VHRREPLWQGAAAGVAAKSGNVRLTQINVEK
jgi:hypothetical protein